MVGDGSGALKLKLILVCKGVDDFLTVFVCDGQVVNIYRDLFVYLILIVKSHPDLECSFTWSETHFSKTIGEFVVPK